MMTSEVPRLAGAPSAADTQAWGPWLESRRRAALTELGWTLEVFHPGTTSPVATTCSPPGWDDGGSTAPTPGPRAAAPAGGRSQQPRRARAGSADGGECRHLLPLRRPPGPDFAGGGGADNALPGGGRGRPHPHPRVGRSARRLGRSWACGCATGTAPSRRMPPSCSSPTPPWWTRRWRWFAAPRSRGGSGGGAGPMRGGVGPPGWCCRGCWIARECGSRSSGKGAPRRTKAAFAVGRGTGYRAPRWVVVAVFVHDLLGQKPWAPGSAHLFSAEGGTARVRRVQLQGEAPAPARCVRASSWWTWTRLYPQQGPFRLELVDAEGGRLLPIHEVKF